MNGDFDRFWANLMMGGTKSCLERDVLRNLKSVLKEEYQKVWDKSEVDIKEAFKENLPCPHPFCHTTQPCERCGRIWRTK